MASSSAFESVEHYLSQLPDDRRRALEAVRKVIQKNLPKGYVEGIQYGMIGYFVPHSLYPAGYHCDPSQPLPFAAIASQKNYMAVYLMCIYSNEDQENWFREEWAKTGKQLDMGKSCVRFKKVDDLALDVIGRAIKRMPVKTYVAAYESVLRPSREKRVAKGATTDDKSKPRTKVDAAKRKDAPKSKTAKKISRKSS